MKRTQTMVKSGFTLIELLVVVAIIALLVAIMMPSLQKAREAAKDAVDKSNLSGLGRALTLYTNDWGVFPTSDMWGTSPPTWVRWYVGLAPYTGFSGRNVVAGDSEGAKNLYTCPSAKGASKMYFQGWGVPNVSYIANIDVLRMGGFPDPRAYTPADRVETPGKTALLADGPAGANPMWFQRIEAAMGIDGNFGTADQSYTNGTVQYWHGSEENKFANFLFADYHVEGSTPQQARAVNFADPVD